MKVRRMKNILLARLASRFPAIADRLISSYSPWSSEAVPWTPVKKALSASTVALVTTAGVHHPGQKPFDMNDPDGDPTYRILDAQTIGSHYTITHDYYDHRGADRDLNVVLPVDRLKQMESAGFIGAVSKRHFGFMGHITGRHIIDLIEKQAPEVARKLIEDNVDAVVATPG